MTEPSAAPPRMRDVGKSVGERIAREHPTLFFTLIYLALTFVGFVHDLWFYLYFKVNILDFSETGDFLLAALRNPLVIVLSIVPVGLVVLLQRAQPAIRRSKLYPELARKYDAKVASNVNWRLAAYGSFVLVYAILFTQIYAFNEAKRIKAGKTGRRIAIMRTDGIVSDEQPVLLGTTGKFLFLYYPSRKATEIVPIDNTAAITIDSRRRKEREADSVAKADSAPKRSAPEDSETDSMSPD